VPLYAFLTREKVTNRGKKIIDTGEKIEHEKNERSGTSLHKNGKRVKVQHFSTRQVRDKRGSWWEINRPFPIN